MSLQASTIYTLIGVKYTDAVNITTGVDNKEFVDLPSTQTPTAWGVGTGATQVNLGWSDTRTYDTTGATLDVTALAAAATNTGDAAFTAIKFLRIHNNSTTNSIAIGGAASANVHGLDTTAITIAPGGTWCIENPSAAGDACGTNKNLKVAASAATASVSITLLGLS